MSESAVYDVAIIGSGPAGYTAAIYAARANMRTLVLQGEAFGGQLMITSEVENYPGFEEGIQGPELMDKFEAQARRFGAEMVPQDVERVDFSQRPFQLWTERRPLPGPQRDRGDGRQREVAWPAQRAATSGARRQRLRHLRRPVLP